MSQPDDHVPDSQRIMNYTRWYADWPAISRDLAALASGLSAIQEAINTMSGTVTRAIEADTRQTTSAIRQASGERAVN